MLKITAEEVNFLVHQYLEETGYKHTAFTFRFESNIEKSSLNDSHVPPSMLLMYLEKALLMLQMETHLDKDDEVILCNQPFTLLSPHICGYSKTTIEKTHMAPDDPSKRAPNPLAFQGPPLRLEMHPYLVPTQTDTQSSKPSVNLAPQTISTAPPLSQLLHPSTLSPQPQNVISSQNLYLIQPQSSMPVPTTVSGHAQGGVVHGSAVDNADGNLGEISQKMMIDTPKAEGGKESGDAEEEKAASRTLKVGLSGHSVVSTNMRGVRVLEGHQGVVYNVAWHPSKRILASGSADSSAKLWQVGDNDKKELQPSSEGGSYKPQLQVLGDSKKPMVLQTLPHINHDAKNTQIDVTSLNWCAQKGMLVTGASDGIARVWSETGINS